MEDAQDLTEVRVLICRKLKLYGCMPVSHIFLQSENEKKMEVGERICQTKEVKRFQGTIWGSATQSVL